MKFSQSERSLHQSNYNPPCNVYQPDHILNNNKILTGSLAPPAIAAKNTFGYAQRFDKQKSGNPGPSSYFEEQKKFDVYNSNSKNRLIKAKLMGTDNSPSIPYCYYGQNSDQQQKNYVKQLLLSQNVTQSCKSIKKKDPAFSFGKSQRHLSNVYQGKNNINKQNNQMWSLQNENSIPEREEVFQQKKTSILWQQKIKKANERRMQVIQCLDPEFVPSLQLIQLIKRKKNRPCPGPGDYYKEDYHPQFQIFENPKGVSFSSVKRFSVGKQTILGPGLYNPKNVENSQKFSFGKSLRSSLQKKDDSNYRFYVNPEPNNQQQTHENRKNRGLSCPFGSNTSRFPQKLDQQSPALTLQEERKKISNTKLNKMIKIRQKIHQRLSSQSQKDEGLLALSTMASTID